MFSADGHNSAPQPGAEMETYCARGSNGEIYPWLAGYGGFVGALDELKIYGMPVAPQFKP